MNYAKYLNDPNEKYSRGLYNLRNRIVTNRAYFGSASAEKFKLTHTSVQNLILGGLVYDIQLSQLY